MTEKVMDKLKEKSQRERMEELFLRMDEDIGRRAELGLRDAHFQYVTRGGKREVFG